MEKNNDKSKTKVRGKFSSNLGFMLAAIGGAVGLGNIWSFPFKCGRGGGFPFILLYIACLFVVGIPLSMVEYGFGRKMRSGPVDAYGKLNKKWSFVGWINMAVCIGVMGFYCLICGWIMKYSCMFLLSLVGGGKAFWAAESAAYFTDFISNPIEPLLWTVAFMVINYVVVSKNIASGIEKSCKFMIPALVGIMVLVAIRSCTLPGAGEGLAYLFKPDFTTFKANGGFLPILVLALLQLFFSVNIGFGTNLMYGSYLPAETNITKSAFVVPIADMIVAMLAGLATIPAAFAFGYEPTAGAGMLFITMKSIFETMAGGRFFGAIFFVAVVFAALSSTIGMTAVIAAIPVDRGKMEEKKASLIATIIPVIIAIPVSLGYSVFSGVQPLSFLGKTTDMLDSLDFICENCLATLGAFFLCIFVGWIWKPDAVIEEIETTGPLSWKKLFSFIIRFVAPVITFVVFLVSIGVIPT